MTYLNESFTLPAIAASIFALFSTSAGRIGSTFVASFVTNRVFEIAKGNVTNRPYGRGGVGYSARLLPNSQDFVWVAMALLVPLFFMIFFMRALYFAPYGEMGLLQRFSGSVIAVASFVVYAPSSFGYLFFGVISDTFPGQEGYRYLFATLATLGVLGAVAASILRRRMGDGLKSALLRKLPYSMRS